MYLARKRHPRGRTPLLSLVLLFAAGALESPALARDVEPSVASSHGPLPEQAGPHPSADAKVHGTITVDFEKVTIAELLKLVSALEKVDGVIHIVSSTSQNGEPTMVVSGSRGTLAVSKPETPGTPKFVIGSALKVGEPPLRQVQRSPASIRSGVPSFPRLAAIGRLLGVVEPADGPGRSRPPTTDSAAPRRSSSLAKGIDPAGPEVDPQPTVIDSISDAAAGLAAGDHFDSLANGGPILRGTIRSPWPAPSTTAAGSERSRDPQVARADRTVEPEPKRGPEIHVTDEGETFEALAGRYYGDSRYAWALWWANRDRIAWPDALTPGKPITIPALGLLDPKMVMTESPGSKGARPLGRSNPRRDPEIVRASHTEPGPDPAGEATGPGGFAVHVVRPEDTLRIIAREKCGDERKALEIIALNRDVLTPEGRPRVGQRLILPSTVVSPAP